MRLRSILKLLVGLFTLALFAIPAASEAQTTIYHVKVDVGGITFCDVGTSCTNPIWNLRTGQVLGASQTLILTQNQPGVTTASSPFNFDSSDGSPARGSTCYAGNPCNVTVSIDSGGGLVGVYGPTPVGDPLNAYNAEPIPSASPSFNEAANWATVFTGPAGTYSLALGYADNVHTDPCTNSHDPDGNCLPQANFGPGGATVFLGSGGPAASRCTVAGTCYDSGALLITAIAAPPTPPGVSHGCTPGFWKNHASTPPWGGYTPTQTVGSVFIIPVGIPGAAGFAGETLLDALQGGGGPGLNGKTQILLRAAVAALLNSANGNPPYPAPYDTPAKVITATNAALNSLNQTTITNLADTFDRLNNQCDAR